MLTLKSGDYHILVSGKNNMEQVYDHTGKLIKEYPCFPHGVNGPATNVTGGDTVPGTYTLGSVVWTQDSDSVSQVKRPYGKAFIYLNDINGCEAAIGRSGIGTHGGGHIEDYWQDKQELTYTEGCIRLHNEDIVWLGHLVESTHKEGGKIYITVTQ